MIEIEDAQTQLQDALDYLLEACAGIALSGRLSSIDKEILKEARRDLKADSRALIEYLSIDAGEAPKQIARLARLVEAATRIASRGIITETTSKSTKDAAAKEARKRGKVKSDALRQVVESAIEREAKKSGKALSTSEDFAELIEVEVRKTVQLEICQDRGKYPRREPSYPSRGAIRDAITKMKKKAKSVRVSPTEAKS